MDKEIVKLKRGQSVQIEVEDKIIEVQSEDQKPADQTDHTSKALGTFMEKVAGLLPELKGEQGAKGEPGRDGVDGKDWKDWKDGEPWKDGRDGVDGKDGKDWKDGRPGRDGKDGKDWKDGERGPRGQEWQPGMAVIGPAGMSAYQIAVSNGFTGTEAEWIELLESQYLRIQGKNTTGGALTVGKAVYITGSQWGNATFSLADKDSEATSSKTSGLLAKNVATNEVVDIITKGRYKFNGLDTSAFTEGGALWLGDDGNLVQTRPIAPAHAVFIGFLIIKWANSTIDIDIQNGFELEELHNVKITSITNWQVLKYNSTTQLWENSSDTGTVLPNFPTWKILFGDWTNIPATNTNFHWDNTNIRLWVNDASPWAWLSIKAQSAWEAPTQSAEILSSSGWTSTDWTWNFSIWFTHTTGNTTTLTNSLAPTAWVYYLARITITARTTWSVTLSFWGDTSIPMTIGVYNIWVKASTTWNIVFTPTTDFNGTIVVSLKSITAIAWALVNFKNSTSTNITELRVWQDILSSIYLWSATGRYNISGYSNTGIGQLSMIENITGYANSAYGYSSLRLNTSWANNTSVWYASMYYNTTWNNNTAIGSSALYSNTTGSNNTSIGLNSMYYNTIGVSNTTVWNSSLRSNTSWNANTALWYAALYANTTGGTNTAVWYNSAYSVTTGNSNTSQGYYSLLNTTTGSQNVAIGSYAMQNNTTGSNNIGIWHSAILSNSTSTYLIAIWYAAGYWLTTGTSTVAIGADSWRYITDGVTSLTSSTNSVYLWAGAKANANSVTNEVVIGYGAIGYGSNTVALGADTITKTVLKGNVGIGTTSPWNKLDVAGVISSSGNSDLWASVGTNFRIAWGFGSPDSGRIFVWDGTGWKFHISKRVTSVTTDLVTFQDNGNVGLWVTSPSARLHLVWDSVGVTSIFDSTYASGWYIAMRDTVSTPNTRWFLWFGSTLFSWLTNASFWIRSQGSLAFASNGWTVGMVMDTSQRVWIWTTTPATNFVVSNAWANGLEVNPAWWAGGGVLFQSYNRWTSQYTPFSVYGSAHTFNVWTSWSIRALDISTTWNVWIWVTSPTASLHLKAGTATAGTAPIKLTAGTNMTTPENGAFEYDGTTLYFTVWATRKTVTLV